MTKTFLNYEWWRTFLRFYFFSSPFCPYCSWFDTYPVLSKNHTSEDVRHHSQNTNASQTVALYLFECIYIFISTPRNEYIFVCKRALQCTHPNVETAGVDIERLVVRFKAIFTRAQCRRCWGKTLFVEESCIIWLPSFGSRKVTKLIFFMLENLKCWFGNLEALY